MLDEAGGGGEKHIRSNRADDDGIDVAWSQPALGEGFLRGLDGKVAGSHSLFNDVAFANADAGENPFVGGVDHFFQVGVGEKTRRHVSAESADLHSGRIGVVNESS